MPKIKPPALVLAWAALPLSLLAADVTGIWKAEFDSQIGMQKYTFTLKQDGTNVTGKANSEINGEKREAELKEGKAGGDTVSFVELLNFQGNEIRVVYQGRVLTNEIKFTREVGEFAKEELVARLEAPPAPPTGPRGRGGPGGFGRGPGLPPGPPSPVPPEVAIQRPTVEEVAKMNAALKQFIATSPDKQLLQKYESLIAVQVPRDNPCIRPTGGNLAARHQGFMNIATNSEFDIMFLGDSITDLWNVEADPQGNPGGKRVFNKYFGDVKVANFGISGDTTQGVLWRLQNGESKGHKPKAVMLMLGTNNTGGSSGAEIAEGIGAVVLQLRTDLPDAKIMLLAIFPRGSGPNDSNRRKTEEANKIIARLHDGKHVFFTDINARFLNEKGGLIGFRPADNLHPIEEGYEIWASSVTPTLKSWIK